MLKLSLLSMFKRNYFNDSTKLVVELYLIKFLDI